MEMPTNPFFRYIWYRVHKYNKMWLQVNTGETRAGKDWCLLTQASKLDPKFSVNQIAFEPNEFLEILDNIKRKGQVVMVSEMGLFLSSRKWQSFTNMIVNEILQTTGYKNPIALFSVPDLSFVDSQARKLVNAFCEVKRSQEHPPKMWIYRITINREGKIFFIHPRIRMENRFVCLDNVVFKQRPPKGLLKDFIEKEESYKDKVRKQHRRISSIIDQKERKAKRSIGDYVDEVKNNIEEYKNSKGKIDWLLIQAKMDISQVKAKQITRLCE